MATKFGRERGEEEEEVISSQITKTIFIHGNYVHLTTYPLSYFDYRQYYDNTSTSILACKQALSEGGKKVGEAKRAV